MRRCTHSCSFVEPSYPNAPARLTFVRAFRPFWITLVCSMVFLGWDYHRRHLRETTVTAEVFVEGMRWDRGTSVKVECSSPCGGRGDPVAGD